MNTKNRNRVITKLDNVLEKMVPFNRSFQYNMKLHLLYDIIDRINIMYSDESITDERIDFIIGNVIYEKIMAD